MGHPHLLPLLLTATILVEFFPSTLLSKSTATFRPPPSPLLPIPNSAQLEWQRREVIMFFHFGMNTFTGLEVGTGKERPSLFDPSRLNVDQWMDVAKNVAGVSLVVLVTKHHDGFCLWPSRYTDHSVRRSSWRGGAGDVVREFVDAAKRRGGIDVGFYLSPWDRHEKCYGNERKYNEFYMAQLRELLGRYGRIKELWLDGAKGANETKMRYHFQEWFQTAKQLQNSINIFSDAGPDLRWVGDENGTAGETCWSPINRTMLKIGDIKEARYLNRGDEKGTEWVAPECDVSIRDGWFWHENQKPKTLEKLLDVYYKSVGRNCVLLLNVPPNTTGLISGDDVERLREFRKAVDGIFSTNLAGERAEITASSERGPDFAARKVVEEGGYWAPVEGGGERREEWIEVRWEEEGVEMNVVGVEEAVWLGQRVKEHEVYVDGRLVVKATTVGHRRLHRLWPEKKVRKRRKVRKLRIRFVGWRGEEGPLVARVGAYYDPYWASIGG